MKIYGEIQGAMKVPKPIMAELKKLKLSRPGGEVVIIDLPRQELQRIKLEYEHMLERRKLQAVDKIAYEKAEMMNLIGVALQNAEQGECQWFKDFALNIYQDAEEFDRNSTKTLLIGKTGVYVLIAYNGKWITGEDKKDVIIRDEDTDGTVG